MRGGRRSSWQVAVLCAALCSLILFTPTAEAAKRVALVIGNDTYETLPALNNARADAKGMAEKLRSLGFDVILRLNASRRGFGRALAEFEGKAANAEVGLVFYAGHGIQAGGTNYLIPANAQIEVEEDLRYEGVDAHDFLRTMKNAGTGLNIVIMDACRDNPLPKRTRSAARGLTITAAPAGIRGTAIVYSAAPGQTAQDGPAGGHGVFTGELLRVLDRPGLSLEQVFKQTAIQVARATNNKQKPWINSSVTGDFVFNKAIAVAPRPTTGTKALRGNAAQLLFWETIKGSKRASDYEAYLRQYPNGVFAELARNRVREFKPNPTVSLPLSSVQIEEMDATYVAVKTANVRSGPGTTFARVGRLTPGSTVDVTGKVHGKNWYRVALAGGGQGFVWGRLVFERGPREPQRLAPRPDGAKVTQPTVTLDRAINLAARELVDQAPNLTKLLLGGIRFEDTGAQPPFGRYVQGRLAAALNNAYAKVIAGRRIKVGPLRADGNVKSGGAATVASMGNRDLSGNSSAHILSGTYWVLPGAIELRIELMGQEESAVSWIGWIPGQDNAGRRLRPKGKPNESSTVEIDVSQKRYRPGDVFKDCDDCPEMVVIPPGRFRMGDLSGEGGDNEKPVHEVRINYSFAVGKFEVTQSQWRAVMGNYPSNFEGDARPGEMVNWNVAKAFVNRLSAKTSKDYRLLSEAEWEYVARAGTRTKYHWGNDFNASEAANGFETEPVGRYAPNAFGLHDVHGNVFEWVEDCWHDNYQGAPMDGSAWTRGGECGRRVLRGGSLFIKPRFLRAAFRLGLGTGSRDYSYGFRIARAL
jgi:formylglycine-generating enzyme required for sulfatase activity/uncharacterized caspase-like protein/uncharacterized protein YraI